MKGSVHLDDPLFNLDFVELVAIWFCVTQAELLIRREHITSSQAADQIYHAVWERVQRTIDDLQRPITNTIPKWDRE